MGSYGKIILDEGDQLLRESELRILQARNGWLNDILIGFCFDRLQKTHPDVGARLYHPGLSQLLKMTMTDRREILGEPEPKHIQYAFWAVNDSSDTSSGVSGSHWSLLVFSRPDNAFYYLDSLSENDMDAKTLYGNLRATFSESASFQRLKCYLQSNGSDCGLHVLANSDNILAFIQTYKDRHGSLPCIGGNVIATATPQQAATMRQHLLQLISPPERNAQ